MIFLYILAGIVAFFVIVLSIPVHVSLAYDDKINLLLRYGFIKINILPLSEKAKKPKKDKPKKEKPKKEPKQKEDTDKKEKEKTNKSNPIVDMLKANGFDGMMEVIGNLGKVFMLYGGKLLKSVRFNDIFIYVCVGTGDAASTAIKYGETCRKIYPVAGFICSNNLVKKYDIDVSPDFLANKTEFEMELDFRMVIRKIINATFGMIFRLIFKVGLKFITNGLKKDKDNQQNKNNK